MRSILTICLLLITVPSFAQQRSNRPEISSRVQIREAEQRLSDLGYWTGRVDGIFDRASQSALIAFQKWEGRPITGRLTVDELEAVRIGTGPKPRDPGYEHVEVDLDRQILLLVNQTGSVRVLPVSTGSGKTFLIDG